MLSRIAGDTGALFDLSGTISNNVTWDEYIYFIEDGAGLVLTGLSFQLQIRDSAADTTARVTLSTADGDLVITDDDGDSPTILRINVPYTTISALDGDYSVDLVAKDADDKLIHYASGIVTFKQSPIAF